MRKGDKSWDSVAIVEKIQIKAWNEQKNCCTFFILFGWRGWGWVKGISYLSVAVVKNKQYYLKQRLSEWPAILAFRA